MAFADRRMTRPMLAIATISTVCLGLTACGGNDSPTVAPPTVTSSSSASTAASPSTSTSESSPESPDAGASTSSGDAVTADFRPGQCYDDTTHWSLTSCTQSHELEIIAVVKTSAHSGDIVKRGILRTWTCNNVVSRYLGSPSAAFSLILGQPVPAAVDTGSDSHIVCAAAVSKPDDSGYQEISYRLKNRIKQTGYVPYRICTSDRPSQDDSPKIVPCSDPHKAETIGGFVIGKADGKYPGSKAVDQAALRHCVPLARTYLGTVRGDVIAAANSTGRSGWQQGTTMTACFVETTTGSFLKPLKGMKHQPLSKFR
jgi:hypothetical protein